MSGANHEEGEVPHEGVRVSDRRRIDPETYEVREGVDRGSATQALADEESSASAADQGNVEAKIAELTDDLQRVHAEYANYRKRVERDREAMQDVAVGGALSELLPVLDDIDRARAHEELEGAFRSVGEALEAALGRIGLERFGEEGTEFDPTIHEALTSEEGESTTEPTVTSVYQPGYRYAGRILRPARVAVAGS